MTTRNWANAAHMEKLHVILPNVVPQTPGQKVLAIDSISGSIVRAMWMEVSSLATVALFPQATEVGQLLVSTGVGAHSNWKPANSIDRGLIP